MPDSDQLVGEICRLGFDVRVDDRGDIFAGGVPERITYGFGFAADADWLRVDPAKPATQVLDAGLIPWTRPAVQP